ncbi:hypothetical protein QBC32DRAFT_312965 [Pseudoneurospora amorphoporcata]|uniref:Uncharacterized protein n=1 Tax=Pseudoneurospora amorphoporcata TaxID=241081 RepID=A0AAN6P0S5_9PEZI|nr:hypothetical protein QBC32DRAFT_312965 [Pseudoneurospora amorphoporcata]
MDSDRGPSPAPHPGSSAGKITVAERVHILEAAVLANLNLHNPFRRTGEQATCVIKNVDNESAGMIEPESTISETKRETMQSLSRGCNKVLNDFRGHGKEECYDDEDVIKAKKMKRKRDDMEERNKIVAQSLQVSAVRLSLSREIPEKQEGHQEEAYFNTTETPDAARIRILEADNNRLRSEIAGLGKALDVTRKELDETQAELKETRTELLEELSEMRSKNYVNSTKDSDSEIRKDWGNLAFLVEQFVTNHSSTMLSLEDTQQAEGLEQDSRVGKICAEPGSVLKWGYVYPYLVESMVWRFIKKEVFDSESKLWAGETGKQFDHICGRLMGCVKKLHGTKKTKLMTAYHAWRSRSVNFFVDLGMDKKWEDNPVAMEMMEELRPFISPKTSRRRFAPEIIRDATVIINTAADLNIQLRKSKADFSIIFSGGVRSNHSRLFGYNLDAGTMDQIPLWPSNNQPEQASPPVVGMAVSPGLIKCGNADGTNYHSEKVLVKMWVVCDLEALFNPVDAEEDEKDEENNEDVDDGEGVKDNDESATTGHATVTPQNLEENELDSDATLVAAPESANNSGGPDSQSTGRLLAQHGGHDSKEKMNDLTMIVAEDASTEAENEEKEGGAYDIAQSKRNFPATSPLTTEGEVLGAEMFYPEAEEAEGSSEAMDLDGKVDGVNLASVPKIDHDGDLQMESV